MNLSASIYAIRWMIRHTFRQARASGILGVMLVVSGLCILICLSVSVRGDINWRDPKLDPLPERLPRHTTESPENVAKSGIPVVSGDLLLGFGAISVPLGKDALDAVRFIQLVLAFGVADTFGILLTLIWTAGFLPTFLEPSAVSVLLAKPVPRWSLLVGKFLGVMVFVVMQAVLFIGGTWLALGLKTGIWDALYLLAIPMLLLHFAIFYSFSVLLAVMTRSTVVCVFGSILFWIACYAMNFAHYAALSPDMESASGHFQVGSEVGYWIMPKPADLGILLYDALKAESFFGKAVLFQNVQTQGQFHPELSILSSVAFMFVMLAIAAYEFVKTEY
jgi:ABC-type transport system involved in multi-copper enzyme maturation permease subunit